MGLNFGDLDNDGWLDFYLGTGTPSSAPSCPTGCSATPRAAASRTSPPPAASATCRRATPSSFGDLDNDGDQDVFEEMGGAYPADKAYSALFENPGNANHWLRSSSRACARTAAPSAPASG